MSHTPTRRTLLGTVAGGAATAVAGCLGGGGGADGPFDGYLADVDNFDGVRDRTGRSTVRVTVGAEGNGGAFAFAPAAVRVDAGTEVVWEWTGEGGRHNVVAEDGAFASNLVLAAGHTFSHAFDEPGTTKYVCEPHRGLGMKGVVVVG
jgi:halocyanin-like protein